MHCSLHLCEKDTENWISVSQKVSESPVRRRYDGRRALGEKKKKKNRIKMRKQLPATSTRVDLHFISTPYSITRAEKKVSEIQSDEYGWRTSSVQNTQAFREVPPKQIAMPQKTSRTVNMLTI